MSIQHQRLDGLQQEAKRFMRKWFHRKSSTKNSNSESVLVPNLESDNLTVQLHGQNNHEAYHTNQQLSIRQSSASASLSTEPLREGPDKYGLFRLDDPTKNRNQSSSETQYPVDIVAVHGMNGDARETWTAEKKSGERVNWLKDFLPEEFPGARVFTYGYPAEIFWTRGKGTMSEYARQLLASLKDERVGRDEHRPIIFICHSMGGIVVKLALNICVFEADEYSEIHNSVKSILFFATPHSGSALASTAVALAKLSNFASFGAGAVRTEVLETLERDSRVLVEISQNFRKQTPRYSIYTFQETLVMKGLKSLIVTQSDGSMCVDTETFIPMLGYDHRTIVRFASQEDTGYKSARGVLRRAVRDSTKHQVETIRAEDEPCLQSLSFPSLLVRLDDIQQGTRGNRNTCTWILEQQNYRIWMSRPQGLLWIKGHPGTGKSTLMAFLYRELHRAEFNPQSKCISFFFDGSGMSLQKSQLGLFRSLLLQLYRCSLTGRETIFKAFQEKSKSFGARWDWQLSELKDLFVEAAVQAAKELELVILVDALDEASDEGIGKVAERLVDYFHRLNERVLAAGGSAKICISCRHYPNVFTGSALQVTVENCNSQALLDFVVEELQSHVGGWTRESEEKRKALVDLIVSKAENQFLWASERIPLVVEAWNDGASFTDICDMLKAESSKLSALYEKILTSNVPRSKMKETLLLLQWVCFAKRPLTLTELRYALACHHQDIVVQGLESCEDVKTFVESDDRMEKLTKSLTGGLAVVRYQEKERYVRFAHETMYEFLRAGGLQLLFSNAGEASLSTDEILGISEETLSRSCFWYLMSSQILGAIECWEKGDEKYFPFIEYSASFWAQHSAKSDHHGRSQIYLLELFESRQGGLEAITKIHFEIIHAKNQFELHIGHHLLHIASSANIPSLARHLLTTGISADKTTDDGDGNTPLHYAARWGHEEMVIMLLDANADVEAANKYGQTALELAANFSDLQIVQLLLLKSVQISGKLDLDSALKSAAANGNLLMLRLLIENGADVNSNAKDCTALQVAAHSRQEGAVRLLVSEGADVNVAGAAYGTALQVAAGWIAYEEELSLVRFLLDSGADVNILGGSDDSPLKAALTKPGRPEGLIELLLDRGADIHAVGRRWGTSLQAAVFGGDIDVIKRIIGEGVDVNYLGGDPGSALHQAVSRSGAGMAVTNLLIANGANVHLYCPELGSTLHVAAYEGSEAAAKLLLDMGLDVNQQGGRHGNPLMAAASGDCGPRMLKLLLDHGAIIDAPGTKFGSPLEAAIYFGFPMSVQVLLERGANVQINGTPTGEPPLDLLEKYRTFLQIAALRGKLQIVEMLLDFGADISARGCHGGALEAAISTGQTHVVECLLNRGIAVDNQIMDHCLQMAKGRKELTRVLLAHEVAPKRT